MSLPPPEILLKSLPPLGDERHSGLSFAQPFGFGITDEDHHVMDHYAIARTGFRHLNPFVFRKLGGHHNVLIRNSPLAGNMEGLLHPEHHIRRRNVPAVDECLRFGGVLRIALLGSRYPPRRPASRSHAELASGRSKNARTADRRTTAASSSTAHPRAWPSPTAGPPYRTAGRRARSHRAGGIPGNGSAGSAPRPCGTSLPACWYRPSAGPATMKIRKLPIHVVNS